MSKTIHYNTVSSASEALAKCKHCEAKLPLGAKPIFQMHENAKILIASQAPGSIAHNSGIPFNDPSGRRLREWLQVDESTFYDPSYFAIMPMAFCYPGKAKSGDAPPRPECAELWRSPLLKLLPNIQLTLLIGAYSQHWHCPEDKHLTLTERVSNWQEHWPKYLSLPHPSPRNNIWLKKNAWFEQHILSVLRARVKDILRTQ